MENLWADGSGELAARAGRLLGTHDKMVMARGLARVTRSDAAEGWE
jgi:hypothetical protein